MDEPIVPDAPAQGCRKFTLGDAMILIVAAALGLAVTRIALPMLVDGLRSIPYHRLRTWSDWWGYLFGQNHFAVSFARFLNMVLLNFVMFLVPACLLMWIKRPRLPLRALIRQTGFAACAAPVMVFVGFLPLALIDLSGTAAQVIGVAAQILLASAPALAWLLLVVTRRASPGLGWLDRLGRILGVVWTACLTAHLVLIRLPY
jgi:hypothetical protein